MFRCVRKFGTLELWRVPGHGRLLTYAIYLQGKIICSIEATTEAPVLDVFTRCQNAAPLDTLLGARLDPEYIAQFN